MGDLALNLTDDGIDLLLKDDSSTLVRDEGLQTAVLISLFTDQRVSEAEVPSGLSSQSGWWGDEFSEIIGDQIGSKIWTFSRGMATTQTAAAIQVRAKQSLDWMIEDGVASQVEVTTSASKGCINISVKILRPNGDVDRFSVFWDGQEAKLI